MKKLILVVVLVMMMFGSINACPKDQSKMNAYIIQQIMRNPEFFINFIMSTYGDYINARRNRNRFRFNYERVNKPESYIREDGVEIIVR